MPFWTYMLHCRDRTFYVGHTDDLDARVAQHQAGTFGGYTARKRPVTLVWSAEFPSREEALAAERQIKGWKREKKLALIRDDWDAISELAKRRKARPSTSSGQTAEGGATSSGKPVSVFLHPHLEHLPSVEFALEARAHRAAGRLHLRYRLTGAIELVSLPRSALPLRRDGLWQHTCLEAFIRAGHSDGYSEFNFSPSLEWAAYRFDSYREGMVALDIEVPAVRAQIDQYRLELSAIIETGAMYDALALNLSAVIEEADGRKSYWAIRHPPGPPDFHHPDCFALMLPAPGGA
ncbi:MAG: GIY-YIG nuclease family protein [Sphingomonas sp.]